MADNKKKQKRLIFRSIVLVILFGAVVFALISNFSKDDQVVKEGEIAPNFSLKEFKGDRTFTLHEDYKGKGVMVNFWATYCEPCKKEMPAMSEAYPKFKEKGVEMLAISLDSTELVINNFIDDYNFTFPIAHDKNGDVMKAYDVFNIPSTFFINPDGTVERIIEGPLTLSKLETYLNEIVPENDKK
jgi:peroxiredoxin